MRTLFHEIDLHIVYLFLFLLPLGLFLPSPWSFLIVGLIPQGRILTRALVDYPRFNRPAAFYLVANESLVVIGILICALRLKA